MSELIDIVDEEDRVIGQASRAKMRRDNLPHRAVYIVVVNSNTDVFVHRRTETKDVYPGCWDPTVGGVVAAGEDYLAAARRELQEELGVAPPDLLHLAPLRYEDADTRIHGVVFLAIHDGPFSLQADEIVSGAFVSLAEAARITREEPCCPDGAEALRVYRRHARAG